MIDDDWNESDLSELEGLDAGEKHALTHAGGFGGTLATDDMAARHRAASLDMYVTGSLRVLTLAIEQDRITVDEADKKLGRWIDEGRYRSPVESITELL